MSNTLNSQDIHGSQSEAEIWDLAIANARLPRAQGALMEGLPPKIYEQAQRWN